jgi:hypothetical protein
MAIFPNVFAIVAALGLSTTCPADTVSSENGGDTYVAGVQVDQTLEMAGDAFIIGRAVTLGDATQGDLHVGAVDVSINADVAEDLYVVGETVIIHSKVAKALSAAAFSLRTQGSAATQGNARLIGNSVAIEGARRDFERTHQRRCAHSGANAVI